MALAKLFSISIYLMLALGALILGIAEASEGESPFPTLLTIPLAWVAYQFSEKRSQLVLSGAFANVCALVALGVSTLEFFSDRILGPVLSGAHLLVYLSWMVIFLQKNRHHYWWTCALSLLQVAVASVISDNIVFGVLLAFFTVVSVFTLSLFSVLTTYRESEDTADDERASGLSQRVTARHVHLAEGVLLFGAPSRALGGVEIDSRSRWIGLRFGVRTTQIAVSCLLLGLLFFLLIPRLWGDGSIDAGESIGGRRMTGFSAEVRLGSMGEILESTQQAMRVQVARIENGEPIPVRDFAALCGFDEPVFRGSVLDRYSQGKWHSDDTQAVRFDDPVPREGYAQTIELQPIGTDHLLCMHPVSAMTILEPKDSVVRFPESDVKVHRIKGSKQVYRYVASTSSSRLSSRRRYVDQTYWAGITPDSALLQFPESGLNRLRDHARTVTGVNDPEFQRLSPGERHRRAAERLVDHLRESGLYGYSLSSAIQDPSLDPVEDFLFVRREGHCEYFASALALMLRSLGIPSRLVTGYKGGMPEDETGMVLIVQQRHAHAWVEAFYEGSWHTLDATPAARGEVVDQVGEQGWSWATFTDSLRDLWTRYVVGINYSQQKKIFYEPGMSEARNSWEAIQETWQGDNLAKTLWNFVINPRRWFSLEGAVVAFVLMLFGLGVFVLVRKLVRLLRRLRGIDGEGRRRGRGIEFYKRFLKLCARDQLSRRAAQTPLEFAADVRTHWSQRLDPSQLTDVPTSLIQRFYELRFGDGSLSKSEAEEIDQVLSRVERALFSPERATATG